MPLFSKFSRKPVGVLAVVSGAICLIASGVWAGYSYHLTSTSLRAKGRIIQLIESQGGHGDYFYPVYTYSDRSGVSHTIHSSVGSSPPAHEVGDVVTVLYSPTNPADGRLNDWFNLWGVPLILFWLGIFYGPVGIVMLLWPRLRRRQGVVLQL